MYNYGGCDRSTEDAYWYIQLRVRVCHALIFVGFFSIDYEIDYLGLFTLIVYTCIRLFSILSYIRQYTFRHCVRDQHSFCYMYIRKLNCLGMESDNLHFP